MPKLIEKIKGSLRSRAERSRSPALLPQERADALVTTGGLSAAGNGDVPKTSALKIRGTSNSNVPEDRRTEPASSTSTVKEEDRRTESTITTSGAKLEDLWDEAYQQLAKENPHLVKDYERILSLEEADAAGLNTPDSTKTTSASTGIAQAHSRLTELASKKLAAVEESRLEIRLGSKTVALKDGVDKVVTVVIAAKDFVSSAISAEPHAALAWAGVCVLLPLLLNPKQQYDDASAGLLEIPFIIRRYEVLEDVYRHDARNVYEYRDQLKEDFEEKLAKLYCKILHYQARVICQWSRNAIHQYGRDVVGADKWANLFEEITDLDSGCNKIAETMDSGLLQRTIEKQNAEMQTMIQDWSKQQQEILKELRDSIQKSLETKEAWRQERLKHEEKEEERACHQAFGPSNYLEHKNRNPRRVAGTCRWALEHEAFIKWQEEEFSKLLWISADPGCGKSVLARSLIDESLLFRGDRLPAVCYFFFKDGVQEQQGAATCISALLHQLFEKRPHLIKYALSPYHKDGQKVSSSFHVTWDILKQAAADPEAGDIICVLDALDECEEDSRFLIIDVLKSFYFDEKHCEGTNLKFLVTSRPYDDIERRLRTLTSFFPTIRLRGEAESEAISREINLVIRRRVPEIAIELELSSDVEGDLLTALLAVPNRTYLWLHLVLAEITRSTGAATTKRLQGLIKAFPDTVDAAYDSILKRATDIVLCRRLLHIVLAALRPLTLEEVNVALHIKDGMRKFDDLDLEDEAHFEKTVRNLCGLFVSVVDKKVFLIHQTAREYLVYTDNCTGHDDSRWKHSFFFSESESILATCCILFLRFTDFEIEVGKLFHDRSDENNIEVQHPFLLYAITSWTVHYQEENSDDVTNDQALDLCDPSSTHFSTWFHGFIAKDKNYDPIRAQNYKGISWTPLLLATYFGFDIMVSRILQRGESVDTGSSSGMTPLMLATRDRNGQIVKILLEADANVNAVDQYGRTALFYGGGVDDKDDPIKILVEFGADVSHKARKGSALQIATDEEDIGRVRFFLSHEAIDVNAKNGGNGTALQTASLWGFVDIAQVLVEHGADVNLNGKNYLGDRLGFPIALAAQRGSKKMMQLLVENGANINAVGGDYESALLAALRNGDLETVEWLLENGADLRHATLNKHNSMSSVFSLAAQGRSSDVFEFLIKYRPDLYPDSPRYALHAAMKARRPSFLRLVLYLCLALSREDLQSTLEIECDLDDVDFWDIKERRALIQEKLDSMPIEPSPAS